MEWLISDNFTYEMENESVGFVSEDILNDKEILVGLCEANF